MPIVTTQALEDADNQSDGEGLQATMQAIQDLQDEDDAIRRSEDAEFLAVMDESLMEEGFVESTEARNSEFLYSLLTPGESQYQRLLDEADLIPVIPGTAEAQKFKAEFTLLLGFMHTEFEDVGTPDAQIEQGYALMRECLTKGKLDHWRNAPGSYFESGSIANDGEDNGIHRDAHEDDQEIVQTKRDSIAKAFWNRFRAFLSKKKKRGVVEEEAVVENEWTEGQFT
jgi:hypothetical protein